MAGLDPAIHAFGSHSKRQDVDARVKPAHDGLGGTASYQSPLDTRSPCFVNRTLLAFLCSGGRAHSSAGERSLHTGEVQGSIPCAPTIKPTKSSNYRTVSRPVIPQNRADPIRKRTVTGCASAGNRASLSTFHHQFGSQIDEVNSCAGETPHGFIIAAPSPAFVPHGFIRNRAHEDQALAATLMVMATVAHFNDYACSSQVELFLSWPCASAWAARRRPARVAAVAVAAYCGPPQPASHINQPWS